MGQKSVYSFLDVDLTLTGPYGIVELGAGNGNAQEGITIERSNDKANMTIGADGSGMHNLQGDNSGKITVRLLKTSAKNKQLSIAYNVETVSSSLYGQGVAVFRNTHTGETHTASGVGVVRFPTSANANDGGVNEWVFNAIEIDSFL